MPAGLHSLKSGCILRLVIGRSTLRVSLAALLAWSGLCMCFAHGPAPAAAVAHDCGGAPPEAQDDPCSTSCSVREAVLSVLPDGASAPDGDAPLAAAASLAALPEPGTSPAEQPGPAQQPPSSRLYILHGTLLL